MILRFLESVRPTLPEGGRRRLAVGAAASGVVAVLDAVGVATVLPLARLLVVGGSEVPGELAPLSDLLGIDDAGRLAWALAAVVVGCFVLKGALALLTLRSVLRVALDSEAAVAARLLRGYLDAPMPFHLARNSSTSMGLLHDGLRRVYQDALVASVPAIGDRLVLVLVSAIVLWAAPLEAVVGGLIMACLVVLYRRLGTRRATVLSVDLVNSVKRSMEHVRHALDLYREVQLSGRTAVVADQLLEVRKVTSERQRSITLLEMLPRYYLELGVVVAAAAVGSVAFARRPVDSAVGVLTLFLAASLRMLPSLNRTLVAESKARAALPSLEQIESDLDVVEAGAAATPDDVEPLDPARRVGLVEVVGASVRFHERDEAALRDVNLVVKTGERVVLVGRSGSGKTTALHLILGLLDAERGQVLVDGAALADRRRSWQRRLAYVPQDVVVMDVSLAENIAFGIPADEIDRDRVREVLGRVKLTAVVDALPDGIDSLVGESGSRISGGERQRLGLARALYARPEFLFLDEATSALDAETEAHVLDILDGLGDGTTVVAVAHREQAIRRFGRVVLFDHGRLAADGSFEELLATQPLFRGLLAGGEATAAGPHE